MVVLNPGPTELPVKPAGAKKPQLFRLSYPDGAHDAEALLIAPDGTLIVVTKTIGAAGVYEPAAGLRAGRTTALRKVGEVNLIDGGDGKTIPAYAAAYPATMASLLQQVTSTLGIDIAKTITGASSTPERS